MNTNSYLEYFLTLLGWMVNNGIWDMLVGTGLFALPLTFRIIGEWIRVREEGEDEGNKGLLLVPRLEHVIYGAIIVICACCIPLIEVSLSTLKFDTTKAEACGYWTPAKPEKTGYNVIVSSLNNQKARIPAWWLLVHKLSKGLTQGAVASLPCRPDIRQTRFDVQHTRINNPALAEEISDFTRDCYAQSMFTWKQENSGKNVSRKVLDDISWLGSKTFLTTSGYYNELQSRKPRGSWPWVEDRDSGYFKSGRGGYPWCTEWWSAKDIGLKARILANVSTDTMTRYAATMKAMSVSSEEYTEALVRLLVSPRNLTVSRGGRVYPGYGGMTTESASTAITRTMSTAGTAVASVAAFPAFDAMRQSLPMVQAVVLMALYIMTPLIIALSGYQFRTAITITFVLFGMNFLTFWWELARWLDSWLLTALYDSDTHSRANLSGLQNTGDDIIMNFVMGTMFLVLPAVWLGALGWAGVNIGHALGAAMQSSAQTTYSAGAEGGKIASGAGKSVMKGKQK
ncbi:conjugal transfer protein TraG N-terminal domain-containing protein [Klebsiella oxytoca]|uniref:conjugal transfer protein TraG N-terminal domain-containing protein n=1 Tax=Klebsiella oxytoca TaxID=571 RepID=UPI00384BD0CE